jgi:hypothetical protein
VVIHGLVNFSVWQLLSWVRLDQGKCDADPCVGGGPYMVNAVARRIYDGDSLFWAKCNRIWKAGKTK